MLTNWYLNPIVLRPQKVIGAMVTGCLLVAATSASADLKAIGGAALDGPRAALAALFAAAGAGDGRAVQSLLYAENPDDRDALPTISDLAVARARLEASIVQKFGADASRGVRLMPDLRPEQVASAHETINGDRAELTFGAGKVTLVLVKGKWLVPVSVIVNRPELAAAHEVGGRYSDMAGALDNLVVEIKQGLFVSADAATQAAAARLADAASGKNAQ